MRSKLVYSAGLKIENRFLLSATVMRAVRKLHVAPAGLKTRSIACSPMWLKAAIST